MLQIKNAGKTYYLLFLFQQCCQNMKRNQHFFVPLVEEKGGFTYTCCQGVSIGTPFSTKKKHHLFT